MSDFTFKRAFTAANPGKIDDFYEIDKRVLGEGSFGQVSKGIHKTSGAVRAIKSIDYRSIRDEARFQAEIDIQMDLDHPNIVKLYETFKDARKIYLVMEMCSGGELFDRILDEVMKGGYGAFSEKVVAKYMTQIMGAVQYLHSCKYAHRDIKPENFLMQDRSDTAEIKVIDFGLATSLKGKQGLKTKAGTPYYVAPEVLAVKGYDEKCDVWSCGVIAYILTCGYPPFDGDNDAQIMRRVKKGDFDFPDPDWTNVSQDLKDMITMMLTQDPEKRVAASEVFNCPWMKKAASNELPVELDRKLARKMKVFCHAPKLKKVALTMIAKNLKDGDIDVLRTNFKALDANQDGRLTKLEILEGIQKGNVELPTDFEKVLGGLDTDGSDSIEYSEFLASTVTRQQYMVDEHAWAAFRMFDKDGDGSITKSELNEVISDLGVSDEILHEVDTDGDGNISFEEFRAMLGKEEIGLLSSLKSLK